MALKEDVIVCLHLALPVELKDDLKEDAGKLDLDPPGGLWLVVMTHGTPWLVSARTARKIMRKLGTGEEWRGK